MCYFINIFKSLFYTQTVFLLFLNMESQIKLLFENEANTMFHGRALKFKMFEPHGPIPQGNRQILFHGTNARNINAILAHGFDINQPGMPGLIGVGVYFSDLITQSLYYCLKNHYSGFETKFEIIVSSVNLGVCQEVKQGTTVVTPGIDSHKTKYDLGFEYCVFDSTQIKPVGVLHLTCDIVSNDNLWKMIIHKLSRKEQVQWLKAKLTDVTTMTTMTTKKRKKRKI